MFDFRQYIEDNFDPKPQQMDPDQMSIHCINPDCDDNYRRRHKMTVNVAQKKAFCFKCGARYDEIGFISAAERISKFAAIKIARSTAPVRTFGATRLVDAIGKLTNKPAAEEAAAETPKPCTLPPMRKIVPGSEEWEYLQRRRIDQKVIDHFGLAYAPVGPYGGRIIIPIYLDGVCISFQARTIRNAPKRYLFPIDQPFGSQLYNYDDAQYFGTIVITEGVTDAWRVWSMGYHNVVATFGKSLKAAQEKAIKSNPRIKTVVFCWDGGTLPDAYAAGMRLYPLKNVLIAELPDGIDPDDCPDTAHHICAAKPIQEFSRLSIALSKIG